MTKSKWKAFVLGFVISLGLHMIGCRSDTKKSGEAGIPEIENALKMELSFGDRALPEEYLLADPQGIAVDDTGNLLVADEFHVKIFDPKGEPLERLGGQGQGPGEFQEPSKPELGPSGFLSVWSSFSEFNIYRPDLTYLDKYQARADPDLRELCFRENLTFNYVTHLIALDEEHRLFHLFGRNRNLPGLFPVFKYLLLSQGGSIEVLVKHHSKAYVLNNRGGSTDSPFLGSFHWALMAQNRLLYAQTHPTENPGGGSGPKYILNLLDLGNRSLSQITVDYEPIPLPQVLKELKPQHFREIDLTIDVPENLQSALNQVDFFPAFKALRTDGDLIFVFMFNPENEKLEQLIQKADREGEELPTGIYEKFEPYSVDVVDAAAGRLIARAQFPCLPDLIKHGRAYRLFKPADDFPKVECYRVDQVLY